MAFEVSFFALFILIPVYLYFLTLPDVQFTLYIFYLD